MHMHPTSKSINTNIYNKLWKRGDNNRGPQNFTLHTGWNNQTQDQQENSRQRKQNNTQDRNQVRHQGVSSTAAEGSPLSNVCRLASRTDHAAGHTAKLTNPTKSPYQVQYRKPWLNSRRKTDNYTKRWKFNKTLLNNHWINEKNQTGNLKNMYLKTD